MWPGTPFFTWTRLLKQKTLLEVWDWQPQYNYLNHNNKTWQISSVIALPIKRFAFVLWLRLWHSDFSNNESACSKEQQRTHLCWWWWSRKIKPGWSKVMLRHLGPGSESMKQGFNTSWQVPVIGKTRNEYFSDAYVTRRLNLWCFDHYFPSVFWYYFLTQVWFRV